MDPETPLCPTGCFDHSTLQLVLDALPDPAVVLDNTFRILAVNSAWTNFWVSNEGEASEDYIGADYSRFLRDAAERGSPEAHRVIRDLCAVRDGEAIHREVTYECDGPESSRWFSSRITQIDDKCGSILITHLDVSLATNAKRELEKLPLIDPLTGLWNRPRFLRSLRRMIKQLNQGTSGSLGVIYLDLDRFASVNDAYGNLAGDEILRTIAARLRSTARKDEGVARIGGDKFGVLVPLPQGVPLGTRLDAYLNAIRQPVSVAGKSLALAAVAGHDIVHTGDTIDDVLARADADMYDWKRKRRRVMLPRDVYLDGSTTVSSSPPTPRTPRST